MADELAFKTVRQLGELIRTRQVSAADVTEAFLEGARETARIARDCGATAAVLKARSPSCGGREIYDGSFSGQLTPGRGVTAALLHQAGIVLYDEEHLPRRDDLKEAP